MYVLYICIYVVFCFFSASWHPVMGRHACSRWSGDFQGASGRPRRQKHPVSLNNHFKSKTIQEQIINHHRKIIKNQRKSLRIKENPQASRPCLRSLIQPSPERTQVHSHELHSHQVHSHQLHSHQVDSHQVHSPQVHPHQVHSEQHHSPQVR